MKYYGHSSAYSYRVRYIITPVEIFPQYPETRESFTVSALWDTGATFTAVSWLFAKRCGLEYLDDTNIDGVGGDKRGKWSHLAMKLPSGLMLPDKRVIACTLPVGTDLIIGMDIIALGDFCISNTEGKTLFSSVVPSLPDAVNLEETASRLNKMQQKSPDV
jgi:hypothetical protein